MTVILTGTWVGRGSYMEVKEVEIRVKTAWDQAKTLGGPIHAFNDEDFGFFVDDGKHAIVDIETRFKGDDIEISVEKNESDEDYTAHARECSDMENPLDPDGDPVRHWWERYGSAGYTSLEEEGVPEEEFDPAFHEFYRRYGFPAA